jgi:HlyD family secretion protein
VRAILRRRAGIAAAIALLLLAGAYWVMAAQAPTETRTAGTAAVRVERGDLAVNVSGTGRVEAVARKDVRVSMGGTLSVYNVQEGNVRAGEVLAELEVQDMSLQLEQSRLDIAIQETELEKLRAEKTAQTVNTTQGGEVTWQVRDGDRIQSGSVIATVTERDYLEVVGRFTAAQVAAISKGQAAVFHLPEHNLDFSGQVAEVGSVPRPGLHKASPAVYYEVSAEFDNPQKIAADTPGRLTVHPAEGTRQAAEQSNLLLTEAKGIRAHISGTLSSLQVSSGNSVREGQNLAQITDPERLTQLNNQISAAETRLWNNYRELSRLEQLADPALNAQIEQLRMDIISRQNELTSLYEQRNKYSNATMLAPGNGVLRWKAKEGDRVQEGSIIATLQNTEKMTTVALFEEKQLGGIVVGQRADFYLARHNLTFQGKVTKVSSVPQAAKTLPVPTALYDVRVLVVNPGVLAAGQAGVLKISTGAGQQTAEGRSELPEALTVRAPLTGTINLLTESGTLVRTGQKLAEIADPDRAEQLKQQIITAELRLRKLQLTLQERINQQSDNKQKAVIRAPLNGWLIPPAQIPSIGDTVAQGTVLGTIVDSSQLTIVIPVDELDVIKVTPGQQVLIQSDALPGETITGQVSRVAYEGKTQDGVSTFDVTVVIEQPGELKAGMTGNAQILVHNRRNTLLVPIEAVHFQDGKTYLQVIERPAGATEGGPGLKLVEVQTGAHDMNFIEILSGVAEGQELALRAGGNRTQQLTGPGNGPPMLPGTGGRRQLPGGGAGE